MTYLIILMSMLISSIYGLEKWLNEFDYHTFMGGSDDKYEIYWNADQDACMLEIGLAVQTNGWVGFGISENGVGMQDADIVIGWITSDGEFILTNRIGAGFERPELFDDQSHITPIEGWKEEIDGKIMTFIRFEKELFPDHDNSVPISIGTTKVIWAYRDDMLSSTDEPSSHGRSCIDSPDNIIGCRSIESINLLQGESTEVPLPQDALEFDVFMPNVTVSNASTTYYCSLLEFPTRSVIIFRILCISVFLSLSFSSMHITSRQFMN